MDKPSSRPMWSGAISFGLVMIPVRLFTAVREKALHFRSLHDQDQAPLKQKMVCSADGKEVHREHIVKGFEVAKDQFVIVKQEELEAAAPKATKAIEIQDFVCLEEIDPVYFDRAYYVLPRPEGAKPCRLLLEAMRKTNKVGIARVVMFGKEYLAALRPVEELLFLETMHFGDEVVEWKDLAPAGTRPKVDDRELRIAEQLIESLTTEFKPDRYHDEYREQVMELIRKKAKGEKLTAHAKEEPAAARGQNLVAALEASLAKARTAKPAAVASGRRRRRSA